MKSNRSLTTQKNPTGKQVRIRRLPDQSVIRAVDANALLAYIKDNFYSQNQLCLEGMNLWELKRAGWSWSRIMRAAEDLVTQGRAILTHSRHVLILAPVEERGGQEPRASDAESEKS